MASFPSKINLNHPLLPLDSSRAAASLQIYRQSLPLMIDQSLQWYGLPCCSSLASSCGSSSCNNIVLSNNMNLKNLQSMKKKKKGKNPQTTKITPTHKNHRHFLKEEISLSLGEKNYSNRKCRNYTTSACKTYP